MGIHKFESTEAFIAFDLDGAGVSSGPVRWARKVLQGGASDLARSQTYTFASLGMQRGGASAGVSAEWPDREAALEAFRTEVASMVEAGTFLPDAAKGVEDDDLAGLHQWDQRDTARFGAFAARCDGLSAAVTADRTVGLDGRTVAIEGLSPVGCWLAEQVVERGARVVAVSTATGTAVNPEGFDVAALRAAFAAEGAECVNQFGDPFAANAVFEQGAAVVFAGSGMGVVDHDVADKLAGSAALVASGRLHLTARGLAVLRRAGVAAPADFVSLAGSTIAAWGDPSRSDDEVLADVADTVTAINEESSHETDGPLLGACYRAESFLSTWQERLPFGRPLAP
jgi:glutamate dehydrogenase/leucine dehydrogenase